MMIFLSDGHALPDTTIFESMQVAVLCFQGKCILSGKRFSRQAMAKMHDMQKGMLYLKNSFGLYFLGFSFRHCLGLL
jgi:hypothetical protein